MSGEPCKTCEWYRPEGPPYTAGICWRYGGASLYRLDGCGNHRPILTKEDTNNVG